MAIPSGHDTRPWNQTLAWLTGSAVAIALMSLSLARGRSHHTSHVAEIPTGLPPVKLSKPIVAFSLIRAVAIAGSTAIAFGFSVHSADWMPIATLIALKPTLQQSRLIATQRLVGTTLSAAIAAVFLVALPSVRSLEEVIILLMAVGGSIYAVNYALYTAAIAAAALTAMDISHPTNLDTEGRRILFTFAGIAIALLVTGLATLLQKRKTPTDADGANA